MFAEQSSEITSQEIDTLQREADVKISFKRVSLFIRLQMNAEDHREHLFENVFKLLKQKFRPLKLTFHHCL